MGCDQAATSKKCRLSITCVTYHPNEVVLRAVLCDAASACERVDPGARQLIVVDNSDHPDEKPKEAMFKSLFKELKLPTQLIQGQGNIGFGRAHNLGFSHCTSDYHLIINPDLFVEPDALQQGLSYLAQHPDVALVTPAAVDANGQPQLIAKRYPSLLVLLLRGFAPVWLQRLFSERLAHYEYRDETHAQTPMNIELASGCFMLMRSEVFRQAGGFCPKYFMYFEDFDLSLRIRALGHRIVQLPSVRVRHLGGHAARKGWRHIGYFLRSAITFFNRHGWKFY